MKKIKLNEILKANSLYMDELEKSKKPLEINLDAVFEKIEENQNIAKKKFKLKEQIAGITLSLGIIFVCAFLILNRYLLNDFILLNNYQGHGVVTINNQNLNFGKYLQIKQGMRLVTEKNSGLILSRKEKGNSIFIKLGNESDILINKIKLYNKIELTLNNGSIFLEMQSIEKHVVQFDFPNYQVFLYGSKVLINKESDKIVIQLIEGKIEIYQFKKLLETVEAGKKIQIYNQKISIENLIEKEYLKIEKFKNEWDDFKNITSNIIKQQRIKIDISNEYYYSFNDQYFCIHNGRRDLYVLNNKSGDVILDLPLPYRSKSIPLVYNNFIYNQGRDKNLYYCSLKDKKWEIIGQIGNLDYSGIYYYNKYLYIINDEGVLYKINSYNKIEATKVINIPVRSKGLVVNEKLYIGSINKKIFCYNLAKEKIEWQSVLSDNVINFTPIIINDVLIIKTVDNKIYGFNKNNGRTIWLLQSTPGSFLVYKAAKLFLIRNNGKIEEINYNYGTIQNSHELPQQIKAIIPISRNKLLINNESDYVSEIDLDSGKIKNLTGKILNVFYQEPYSFYYIYSEDEYLNLAHR